MNMEIVKLKKMTLLRSALAVATLAIVGNGAAAATDAYTVSSDGDMVRDSSGDCVQTGSWKKGLSIPECDAALAAKLEAERLAAEEASRRAAELAAMETKPEKPKLVRLSDEGEVAFKFDSAILTPEAERELEQVARSIERYDQIDSIEVTGYTDSSGPENYNQMLSERRAASVKEFLVSRGVSEDKVSVSGMGESGPIADNSTREGRARNRRVDIRISGVADQE
jgi:OOP family OmpA-OmpF porin